MSQKVAKRTRRHTEEEEEEGDRDFKNPNNSKTKDENSKTAKEVTNGENETNGLKEENESKTKNVTNGENDDDSDDLPKRVIETRSRSKTPLKKNLENPKNTELNDSSESADHSKDDKSVSHIDESNADGEEQKKLSDELSTDKKEDTPQNLADGLDTEPLVEKEDEEVIPELQYDENDIDVESEGSPSRCKTRRSQTRNVSTPKTPKTFDGDSKVLYIPMERLPEDNASGRSTPKKTTASSLESNVDSESQPDETVDLDNSDSYSSVSIDNVSTRAVAGSDATRNVDLTYQDSGLFEDSNSASSTPMTNPNRSLAETLRGLSRRSIRPMNNDYRKRALQNTLESKGDIYANYESVERVTPGIKRKNRNSATPEDDVSKRLKKEGAGLFSYISSPILSHFKNSKSSTPKLISYEKNQSGYDEPVKPKLEISNSVDDDPQKKWCSIM